MFVCNGVKKTHTSAPGETPTRVIAEIRSVTTIHHADWDGQEQRWKRIWEGKLGIEIVREINVCPKHMKRFAKHQPKIAEPIVRNQYNATAPAKKPRQRSNENY